MTRLRIAPCVAAAALLTTLPGSLASAQQVNPATSHQAPQQAQQPALTKSPTGTGQDWTPWSDDAEHLSSWELPPVVVSADSENRLFEEDRVGSYGQPRWTAKRLFPTTRVYVVPEGKVEVEHWTRVKTPRDGKTTVENQYEIEFGLPNRFQLDLYFVTEKTGSQGDLDIAEQKFELRYALADWGVIPWNPTLYAEWVESNGGADKIEAKLLLGDELAPTWHWGANLVYEHEVSGDLESEYELTFGISHTLIDSKLAVGAEMKAALVDTHADRGDFEESLEIGPSLRYQPTPNLHIDFAPLVGIGHESRESDIYLVIGYEF